MTDLHALSLARLDEIQARIDAATPGPWETVLDLVDNVDYGGRSEISYEPDTESLIVNAPADLAALVTALRGVLELHGPAAWPRDHDPRTDPCRTVRAITTALGVTE